jgi:hypothetical protein
MTTTTMNAGAISKQVRWSWLWSPKTDFVGTLLPFWLGFALVLAIVLTGGDGTPPIWSFHALGRQWTLPLIAMTLYGPLVDGPHIWATIARTYADPEERAARKKLLLYSLLFIVAGPVVVVLPYLLHALFGTPDYTLSWGNSAFFFAAGNYAQWHIQKQHWGFVALYKRKNGDSDALENKLDSWFFNTAIWLPYFAYFAVWTGPWGASPIAAFVFEACHVLFLASCSAYVLFQLNRYRQGRVLNGAKLLYMATVLGLYYVTFALDPYIASFWVLITSTGHCAQYHAVVWAYGKKKYAGKPRQTRNLSNIVFDNAWVYIALSLVFTTVTLQGLGTTTAKRVASGFLQSMLFSNMFTFLDMKSGLELGVQMGAAAIFGVRVHHFFVDSQIWRVGKSPELRRNLSV